MYGLIGKKLSHSFSAEFFNKKFAEEGISESYRLFPLESISLLPALLEEQKDLKGLNVTIPYKEQVIPFLTSISPEAEKIGAVNVIKINREGNEIFLEGHNSDCIGFRDSLLPLLNPEIKKALVLGTGGASKAVEYVLNKLGIEVAFVSRNPKPGNLNYHDLDKKIMEENLLIVNTTPLGMYPDIDSCPDIPYQYLTPRHVCYDLVYNPEVTEFLRRSALKGAKVKNGLEMLLLQALASWDIWQK